MVAGHPKASLARHSSCHDTDFLCLILIFQIGVSNPHAVELIARKRNSCYIPIGLMTPACWQLPAGSRLIHSTHRKLHLEP
jgi:hypothetical protein